MQSELIHAHIRNLARETGIKVFTFAEVSKTQLCSCPCASATHCDTVDQTWPLTALCCAVPCAGCGCQRRVRC